MDKGNRLFDPNIFETDLDFYVRTPVSLSPGGKEKTSCRLDQGFNLLDFLIPDDRSRATKHAQSELSGKPVGAELYRVQSDEHNSISVAIEMDPLYSPSGGPEGVRITITDVHRGKLPGTPTPIRGIKPFQG